MPDTCSVLAHLQSEMEDMTVLLKDLVRMETPSTDPASQEPIKARLKSEFEALEFRVRTIPGRRSGGHIFAGPRERKRNQPLQLMLGHCDTVWPLGLFFWGTVWTLGGWCELRNSFRNFRLDRMQRVEQSGEHYPLVEGRSLNDMIQEFCEPQEEANEHATL